MIDFGARWVGTFKLNDARTHIRPIIYFSGPWKSTLRVEFKMEIQNTQPSNKTYSTRRTQLLMDEEHLEGPEIAISDVLNEENGWLSNGKLSVEYGIEVLAEKRVNDGWRFNFEVNAAFDSYMEFPVLNGMLYSHLFLIRYHSSIIDDWYLLGNDQPMLECWENLLKVRVQKKTIENCLQIVHGVNLKISNSINGEFHYTNFEILLEANVIPENDLTIDFGARWVGTFKLNEARTHIRPIIYFSGPWKTIFRVKIAMKIQNTKRTWNFFVWLSRIKYSTRKAQLLHDEEHLEGPEIPISEVLNEENGWLSRGKLTVEYGIEVVAEKRVDDGWSFNFEGNGAFNFYMKFPFQGKHLYSHVFLIRYHSKMINEWYLIRNNHEKVRECMRQTVKGKVRQRSLKNCLQIVNGVNIRISMPKAIEIICSAHRFKFHNVLEYCQREIIQRHLDLRHFDVLADPYTYLALVEHNYQPFKWFVFILEFSMKLSLRHYLVHLLRDYDSLKSMTEHLKLVDLDSATGESMKMIVAMFIYGKEFTRMIN
uniref:BTB domain-containing protein n=1 Tax=Caenorhabditis tropicalis TaxID=1561998 RepID=A0A1I7UE18_9PELO